jgi:hypothetical protein
MSRSRGLRPPHSSSSRCWRSRWRRSAFFGVPSYAVSRRGRKPGVRAALGASPSRCFGSCCAKCGHSPRRGAGDGGCCRGTHLMQGALSGCTRLNPILVRDRAARPVADGVCGLPRPGTSRGASRSRRSVERVGGVAVDRATPNLHSSRRATIGSTVVARRTGTNDATSATTSIATAASTSGTMLSTGSVTGASACAAVTIESTFAA